MNQAMGLLLFLSVLVSFVFALVTLGWFFRDGADTDRSLEEFSDRCLRPFSYTPWWATKGGLWVGLSIGAGVVFFNAAPVVWQHVRAFFR